MKLKVLFSILFLSTWQGLVWGQESACIEEGLHPFWAQEYTGADLLREKLQKSTQWEVPDHLFQIWDGLYSSHGEKVSNLIASPYPSATIPSNKHFDYIGFDNLNQKSKFYDSFMRCQEENSCPSYTNISMDIFSLSKEGFNVFDLIDRANIVTVTSAGNDERFMNSIKREYARNQDLIAVGNCGINGNPYHNSNYAPEVTVCAPADHNILRSYDFAGRIVEFGGTSGAAPQVTAALAAFTAITGYYLKPQESIEILKKTAIPHPHLPTQSNMGAGMLNTWKIGEVAFKLRKRCQENKTCYADSLQSEDTFKFYVDKPSLIKWTSDMEKEGGSREEKENLLKDLRKAALLNSFDEQLWGLLASVNRKRCLEEQAQYYQSLANRAKKTDQELLYELEKTGQYSMLKYLYFSHEEMKEDLTELYFSMLEKEEDIDREALIDLSKALISNEVATSPRQKELWEMLINHSKIDGVGLWILGTEIAFSAENISDHEKLLQMIINHSKISGATLGLVGEIIAHNAENISGHEKLLQMIISHSKINGAVLGEVGRGIAHYSKNIPSYESFLQKIISHPKIHGIGLGEVSKGIALNAEDIPAHEMFFQEVINHSKIDETGLEEVGVWIAFYAENIPAHEKLLLAIINHSKIDGRRLGEIARSIRNAKDIPDKERLLEAIGLQITKRIF